jgi:hypothetical protein
LNLFETTGLIISRFANDTDSYYICIGKYSTIVRYVGIATAIVLILSTFAFPSLSIPSNDQIRPAYALPESACIVYDPTTLTITVSIPKIPNG